MTTQILGINKIEERTSPILDTPTSSLLVQNNTLSWAQKLIKDNGSPFAKDESGFSPLDHAVFLKDEASLCHLFQLNPGEYKESVITSKTCMDIKNAFGRRDPIARQKGSISQFILTGNISIVSNYLQNSPYIFDLSPRGSISSLHLAAMGPSKEMIALLCGHGFLVDAKDKDGRTSLHYAALNPNKDIFLALLEEGAYILEADSLGCTPLDLLVAESKTKDPLQVYTEEKLTTLSLLITTIIKESLANQFFGNYSNSMNQAMIYLLPMSQIALMLQGTQHSKKAVLISSALYFAAQNFTLSRLALNAFIIAKAATSLLSSIQDIYSYASTRPIDTFKKVGVKVLQTSIVGYNFSRSYSLDYLKNIYQDLSSLHKGNFFETMLGEETLDELDELSYAFSSRYDFWYSNLKASGINLLEMFLPMLHR